MSFALFIGVLVILIVVHECGHFLVAKLFGIRVDEFGVGYPPRAFTLGRRGDTTYTLNWLPFGGFVKIFGERNDITYSEEEIKVAFTHKSKWIQAAVLVAGVVFNIMFAWVLFSATLMIGTPASIDEADAEGLETQLVISSVMAGTPANAVGLIAGDEIVGVYTSDAAVEELVPSETAAFIQRNAGEEIVLSYIRSGEESTVALTPVHGVLERSPGTPAVGIAMTLVAEQSLSLVPAIVKGFSQTMYSLKNVTIGLGVFFGSIAKGTADWSQVAGPVGIAGLVGDASSVSFIYLLYFTAFISINLAIINLIPLPALDGGRLLFVAIEGITQKPINEGVATFLNVVGFSLIILLMIVVTYYDIVRLI
tara:strand:- start:17292 stop:18389 length:1098 start_codon:yes stop_codon:yes gene_type:complete